MFGGLNLNKPATTTNPLFLGLNVGAPAVQKTEPEKPKAFDLFSGLGNLPPQPAGTATF